MSQSSSASSNDDRLPTDVPTPTLNQIWSTAPKIPGDMVGASNSSDGSSGNKNQPPPAHQPFGVYTGQIEDLENTLLSATQTRVDNYNNLKDYANSTKSWIFTMPGQTYTIHKSVPQGARPGGAPNTVPVQSSTDPNPDTTSQMSDISDNLLKGVADTLELVGQYIALLDNAAQIYGKADMSSKLPSQS